MSPSPLIRNADPNDIDAMVLLLKQLFEVEADFTFTPEAHQKGLALMLDGCGKHRAVKVAEINGRVVGMCTAQTRISTASGTIAAVIEDLVVDESFRGKGLGQKLLDAVYTWAKNRGISNLQLLADKHNTSGLAFYRARRWQSTSLICLTRKI